MSSCHSHDTTRDGESEQSHCTSYSEPELPEHLLGAGVEAGAVIKQGGSGSERGASKLCQLVKISGIGA